MELLLLLPAFIVAVTCNIIGFRQLRGKKQLIFAAINIPLCFLCFLTCMITMTWIAAAIWGFNCFLSFSNFLHYEFEGKSNRQES